METLLYETSLNSDSSYTCNALRNWTQSVEFKYSRTKEETTCNLSTIKI